MLKNYLKPYMIPVILDVRIPVQGKIMQFQFKNGEKLTNRITDSKKALLMAWNNT